MGRTSQVKQTKALKPLTVWMHVLVATLLVFTVPAVPLQVQKFISPVDQAALLNKMEQCGWFDDPDQNQVRVLIVFLCTRMVVVGVVIGKT
jgi:hypothetical protein